MGDSADADHHYEGWRDYGQHGPQIPKEVVHDGREVLGQTGTPRDQIVVMKEFFFRLKDFFERNPILSKRPAFVEPPYWAKPKVLVNSLTLPFTGSPDTLVLSYKIPDRHRIVVTAVGISVNPVTPYTNHQLLFWFALSNPENTKYQVLPYLIDQSAAAAALAGYQDGKSTVIPGSDSAPFNLLNPGTPLRTGSDGGKGDKLLQLRAQNFAAQDVTLCALVTLYEYWLPESAEYEKADNQI